MTARPAAVQDVRHLIGGEHVAASSGETFDDHDPHDGSVIARVARGTREDAERAVEAARRAFDEGPWPRMSTAERRRLLNALADLIEANGEELALLETRDCGKPGCRHDACDAATRSRPLPTDPRRLDRARRVAARDDA